MSNDTNNVVNTGSSADKVNADELGASIQSMVRGTDNNGNYTFMPYSSKSPVTAQEGYRVAKVTYKTNKTTNTIAGENSCLIIPKISEDDVAANIERLIKHVICMLESEQDKLAKGYHLEQVTFVEPEGLSIDSIIEALEAIAVSGRINKEMIEEWFAADMEVSIVELMTGKLEADKIPLQTKLYKNMFAKMASNTTQYQPTEAQRLLTVIEKCGASDTDIGKKLSVKLDKMINPVTVAELADFL